MLRPKTPVDSFRHALNGLLLSFKTQRHLRIHFVVAVLVLGAGFVYRLNRAELLLLVGAISFVILAELLNTALETVVDLVTTDYHPLARVAKDVAAGAVLVAAVNAALFGLVWSNSGSASASRPRWRTESRPSRWVSSCCSSCS